MKHAVSLWFGSIALALGCAPDLAPGDDEGTDGETTVSGSFRHAMGEDGAMTTVVDATLDGEWRHLDLESAMQVDPSASGDWDLAFSRYRIRLNGGASGSGRAEVAIAEGDYDALTTAPDSGWAAPVPDGADDEDTEPDNAFNNGATNWYEYNRMTHVLTSRGVTYVIATGAERFYKLQLESYYDDAGSPAWVRFRWAPVAAPQARTREETGS